MIKFKNIESNLKSLQFGENKVEFILSFLRAFEFPESTLTRIKLDHSDDSNIVKLKKKILFIYTPSTAIHLELEKIKERGMNSIGERFVAVFNKSHLLGYDVKTKESVKTSFKQVYQYLDFFMPLLGQEKAITEKHQSVDIKAAEKLAAIYNEVILHPDFKTNHNKKDVDLTISRLLFCFWVDSLGLLGDGKVKRILNNHTLEDGSNTQFVLNMIFGTLYAGAPCTAQVEFQEIPKLAIDLFSDEGITPPFSKKARKLLIELSDVDWSDINPDILGSLIQSVVDPDDNSGLSNHYTSSSNILKVIGPLFLDELYTEFEQNKNNVEQLTALAKRIQSIKVFDPSCGAGNFLVISLKELNLLCNQIKEAIHDLSGSALPIQTNLDQFYGIEESFFKHQIARIGLCIESFRDNLNCLSIDRIVQRIEQPNILNANPTQVDWSSMCGSEHPKSVFIVSNPTYRGARKQTPKQKEDVALVFREYNNTRNLDFSSCWLYLASKYIEENDAICSIVTTNSLVQGEQVELLWPKIFRHKVEICFAHTSFKWRNNSKGNTGVTVIIIGLCRTGGVQEKKLYGSEFLLRTNVISPYLTTGINLIVKKRSSPLSSLPPMPKGNMPYDGGSLILSKKEKDKLTDAYPHSTKFIKKLLGSKEFIQGLERWCLWISDELLEEALSIAPIKERIQNVHDLRASSTDKAARRLAERSHQFREINSTTSHSIIIPSVSSERREYIPIGFVDESIIITNLAFAIYDCEPWMFGLLTSKMHNLWIKTVCGSLETRIRYSSRLGYNTFPFPNITVEDMERITMCVFEIIEEREKFPEKSLALLYDPDKMPRALLTSHRTLDKVIDSCYRSEPFSSDQERIDHLFNYYNELT